MEFHSAKSARTSPLAERLFTVPGVSAVEYGPDYITVSKTKEIDWKDIKPRVKTMMKEALEDSEELVVDPAKSGDSGGGREKRGKKEQGERGTEKEKYEPTIEPYGARN